MGEKRPTWEQIERDRDEPVKLPVDPEAALRGFLAVDPESGPTKQDSEGSATKKRHG